MENGLRGKYWDDHRVGDVMTSSGRTVTDYDISAFSALSGDFNPLHVDDELAKNSIFGVRVPHGPLGILLALGGYDRIGIVEGMAVAFLGVNWRFVRPLLVGDTVRTKVTVAKLEPTKNLGRGKLTMFVQLINQRDEVVQEGEHTFMIRRRIAENQE